MESFVYKKFGGFEAVVKEFNMKKRSELDAIFAALQNEFKDKINGPAFCKINYISSVTEGYWVEAGFPVTENVKPGNDFLLRFYDELKVIAVEADKRTNNISEKYTEVYDHAYKKGMISDEFVIEVYPEGKTEGQIEILFIEHDWTGLFLKGCKPYLKEDDLKLIERTAGEMGYETSLGERFDRIKEMVEIVDRYHEPEKYKIISGCSHIFPKHQLEKLRAAYLKAEKENKDPVDAVIAFMENDPGWVEASVRKGNEIYSEKKPSNKKAFDEAKTDLERKKAYCFCPLIKENLDKGMGKTYCYCGAGWYRQQWEYATGKEVRVEIMTSILDGDDKCSFKVILS